MDNVKQQSWYWGVRNCSIIFRYIYTISKTSTYKR